MSYLQLEALFEGKKVFGLPAIVMDDDFFEFLEENSIEGSMDVHDFCLYLHQWLKEECK
jgi:hypothetical protein